MEMKIDKLLKENGWVSQPNYQGEKFKYYSSITSDVIRKWRKEGKETTVITGLNVKGYSPCLIDPLPNCVQEKMYKKPDFTPPDPIVIDWVQKSTDEEINVFLDSIK